MAKKPAHPSSQPPPSSSSSSSSSEEENSSKDEEQTNDTKLNSQKPLTKIEESESEESIDEEEEDEDEDQKPRSVNSIPSKPEPKSESESEFEKILNWKSSFIRLWSLDDDIAILEAMVDYQSKNGPIKLFAAGVKNFHESVKKSLSINVGAAKLATNMRRLWKKYTDANKKGDKIKFAKPHDKTIYELSKNVWGKEKEEVEDDGFEVEALNGNSSGVTVNKGKSLKREFPFIRDALGGNRLALEMLEKADGEKVAALEKKFKKLKFAEINLIRKAYNVVCEEAEKLVN